MPWIRRSEPPARPHKCEELPVEDFGFGRSPGQHGDLWRCGECGRLWVTQHHRWYTASPFLRWRYRNEGWGHGQVTRDEVITLARKYDLPIEGLE